MIRPHYGLSNLSPSLSQSNPVFSLQEPTVRRTANRFLERRRHEAHRICLSRRTECHTIQARQAILQDSPAMNRHSVRALRFEREFTSFTGLRRRALASYRLRHVHDVNQSSLSNGCGSRVKHIRATNREREGITSLTFLAVRLSFTICDLRIAVNGRLRRDNLTRQTIDKRPSR